MRTQDDFFQCMVHNDYSTQPCDEDPDRAGFCQNYYVQALNLGDAIQQTLAAASSEGMNDPWVDLIRPTTKEAIEDASPIPGHPAWKSDTQFAYRHGDESHFALPHGIVPSWEKEELDPDEISAGYSRQEDNGLTTIAVNVAADDLWSLYKKLLYIYPEYKVFWYLLHEHWEETSDQFFTNEELNSPDRISSHLEQHQLDSIQNGYVTLTAYREEGATNLNISEHKQIVVLTHSPNLADQYAQVLEENFYFQVPDLVSIDQGIYHWHYRLPGSRSRQELITHLKAEGFDEWIR